MVQEARVLFISVAKNSLNSANNNNNKKYWFSDGAQDKVVVYKIHSSIWVRLGVVLHANWAVKSLWHFRSLVRVFFLLHVNQPVEYI